MNTNIKIIKPRIMIWAEHVLHMERGDMHTQFYPETPKERDCLV
jgi:hypothetical protein